MNQTDDSSPATTDHEKVLLNEDRVPLDTSPLVSIIVRTKDRPKLLCEALRSIASQTYDTIEVVLVNDGGCTLDIEYLKKNLGETTLVHVQNEHSLGRSGAGNIGLAHCRGKYFAFLDDDDALLPDHLQTLISFLENSDYKIAYSDVIEYQKIYDAEIHGYRQKEVKTYSSPFLLTELLISNYIPFNALLFDITVLAALETHLDPMLELYEDWDFLIRLALKFPFYHIKKVTACYYKWSDALQINNLSHFDSMRSHQKIVAGRYLSHLPAEYIIQLWQGHQRDTGAIEQLKNEMLEKEDIIEDRQKIINDMEVALEHERNELDRLQKTLHEVHQTFQGQLEERQQIIENRQEIINNMEVALDDEREQVSSLQKKLHAVHIEFEARVDEQARHIANQQAVIYDMEAALGGERNQVELLKQSLENATVAFEAHDKREREKWQQKEGEYLRIVSQCKEEIRVALDEKNGIEQTYRQEREAFHVQENASQQQIQMANQEIHRLNEAVHLITISFAWRLVLKYRNLLGKIAPPGSMRWRAYQGGRKRLGQLYRFLRGIKIPEPSDPVMELVSASVSDIDLPKVAASMENGEPKSPSVPSSNRIILVSHDFEKAGAQINLLHIGKSLKAVYGKEVIFLALQNGAYREAFEAVGDEVMDLGLKLDNALEISPEIEKVFRDHKAQGVQFCLCNTVVCGVLAPLLDQLGYHFIHLIHELPILIDVCQFHQPIPAMKQHASMVVFSSEYARNTYIDRYGFERSKTVVRPQGSYFKGVPAHEKPMCRQTVRDRLYLPRDATVVLSCGYMSLRKAPDVFIALAGKIVSDPGHRHIHFVWLGGYELEVMNWVKSDVEKMGLTPNVHFVDFVDDPAPFFAGADIFVMPSREDPFPTVVLEAMDNGVPTIAFDNAGGIPELLTDGCGIIVPYLDVDAMQREIVGLLEDEKRYQTIVDKAKERVRDAFDFDDYTGFLLELLEGMPTHDMDGGGHAERNEKEISSIETGRPNVANSVGSAVKNSRSYVRQVLASNRKAVGEMHVKFTRHDPVPSDIRMIAFYLPQFHPVPENDAWWGKGFTEWQNVSKAVPQFIGHDQPRLPGELGFYDLRLIDIQKRQVELAKNYGIQGFCYYYYWFSGRKILERPLEQMLAHPEIDFPFCLCWANENWSRRWDGSEDDVLLEQHYYPEDAEAFINDIAEVLSDQRYIRINGKPLLLVYRAELLPDPVRTTEIWRTFCRNNGIGEIYLCHIHSFEAVAPSTLGFDAAIEFPPNTFPVTPINDTMEIVNPDYSGTIYNYEELIEISCADNTLDYKKYRGITTGWDNEARKPGRGTLLWMQHRKSTKCGSLTWLILRNPILRGMNS